MNTKDIYYKYRDAAIQEWIESVYATYPFNTKGLIRTQKDPFSNPIGAATQHAARILYDAIIGEDIDIQHIEEVLSKIIRIRAIQEFRPEQAVGIIQLYKPILQKFFLHELQTSKDFQEYLDIDTRIDALMLMAFNYYVDEREKLYIQRVEEQKRQSSQLKRWAIKYGLIME